MAAADAVLGVFCRGLAAELAALPQACLREDRLSVLEQHHLDDEAALANELRGRHGTSLE